MDQSLKKFNGFVDSLFLFALDHATNVFNCEQIMQIRKFIKLLYMHIQAHNYLEQVDNYKSLYF